MMDVINIVFRFFDFFVILGIGFYGVRKYVIPAVEKILREYGVFIYNLESDCKNLQSQAQSIYERTQDQEREFQLMQAKFSAWQAQCDKQAVLQKLEQQKTDHAIEKAFILRSNYIKKARIVKTQLPVILQTAMETLQHKYHEAGVQKQYIDELIDVMKEQS